MIILPRADADNLWDTWWDEMSQEWFKLEVLQDYTPEDDGPSLRSWLQGDKKQAIELMEQDQTPETTAEWTAKISQGVKLIRIHVTDEPLTPYMEWEIEFYRQVSIPHRKEKVYLVKKSQVSDVDMPAGDLMIFDLKRAVVNKYDSHGLMTHQTFYERDEEINHFLALRQKLIGLAKPLKS